MNFLSIKTVHPETLERWPNFFIVGAPKAGTTSLYEYLKAIPGIYMSSVKEPKFFSSNFSSKKKFGGAVLDKKKYLSLFAGVKDEKILGDASPAYLADPNSARLIHEVSPKALILISLRDPVERIYSNYLMQFRNGRLKGSFNEEIKKSLNQKTHDKPHLSLKPSQYMKNIKPYFEIFGEKQVKIIIFEEWIRNPKKTIEEILDFLGLQFELSNFQEIKDNIFVVSKRSISKRLLGSTTVRRIAFKTLSQSKRGSLKKILVKPSKKPKMEQEDCEILIKFYSDDVRNLQEFLGRKLPWKNFQN